jgi:hypothetical protein
MFLEINTRLGHLFLIYPVQILLIVILIVLGLLELYYFFDIRGFLSICKNLLDRKINR